ncbi:unnamed protein product, partial [Coccothraustes coccothraustes]
SLSEADKATAQLWRCFSSPQTRCETCIGFFLQSNLKQQKNKYWGRNSNLKEQRQAFLSQEHVL